MTSLQRPREEVRNLRSGPAMRYDIAFGEEEVVRGNHGIARNSERAGQFSRGWQAHTRLQATSHDGGAQLPMQLSHDKTRAVRRQVEREVEDRLYWIHKKYKLWFFSDTNHLIYRRLRHHSYGGSHVCDAYGFEPGGRLRRAHRRNDEGLHRRALQCGACRAGCCNGPDAERARRQSTNPGICLARGTRALRRYARGDRLSGSARAAGGRDMKWRRARPGG